MGNSGNEDCNVIGNVTTANEMYQLSVFDHHLIKIVFVQKLANNLLHPSGYIRPICNL